MLGESIGHYRITSKLGEGGMGAVYRATDTKLNREVAIKVLPDTFAADPDRLARFTREAQVLASLNHPNIATIFGVEDKALVMELVEGNDLSGPLPLHEALNIAKQIAEGLEAAHDKGIIHRDLKPANIKVTPDGVVKLLDFGLAKATDSAATTSSTDSPTMTLRATQAGLIMGTAGYMSPEQAAGKTVDKRADIWAFGVVLHELLTGKKLFHGETVSHTLASVLKDPIDFAIPQAPKPIQQLLARCLDRNLKHRLKDIGEARIAIEDFLTNPKPKESAKPAARPTLWMAIAAASLLLAITTTSLWLLAPRTPPKVFHFRGGEDGFGGLLSPNGEWAMNPSAAGLYLRRLNESKSLLIPGTAGILRSSQFWAQDSSAFGFVSNDRLKVFSLNSSLPRDLMPVDDFRGASWRGGLADGMILVATAGKLKLVHLKSGEIRDLPLQFKPKAPPAQPVFLPKGDGFVYLLDQGLGLRLVKSNLSNSSTSTLLNTKNRVEFGRHPRSGAWHVFYLAGEEEFSFARYLMTAPVDPQSGALLDEPVKILQGLSHLNMRANFWVGEGGVAAWVYSAAGLSIWRLSWVDRKGNLISRLAENRGIVTLALSPDESKIAAQLEEPDPHIWIFDAQTGAARRLTNSTTPEHFPCWAADGKSLYYSTGTSESFQIMNAAIDTSHRQRMIWQARRADTELPPLCMDDQPDGRLLLRDNRGTAFFQISPRSSNQTNLEAWPIPRISGGYSGISVAPDHKIFALSSFNGISILPLPFIKDAVSTTALPGQDSRYHFFSHDGKTLFASIDDNLFAFPVLPDFRLGQRELLFPWRPPARLNAQVGAASRDGKRLLIVDTDNTDELRPHLISDWTTLLPK